MMEYNARPVLPEIKKEEAKEEPEEIKVKIKNEFNFADNKFAFYSCLFYSLGLFLGSYFYKIARSDKLDELAAIKDNTFSILFLSNFCVYLSIFLIVAFLGFCLISYPIINIFPALIGFVTGIKLAFYFITYQAKGVGYSLIMIVPYIALFVTVITYVMKESTQLSERINKLTKGEGEPNFEMLPYLKKYLLLALLIVAVTLIDTCFTKLLFSVVTI